MIVLNIIIGAAAILVALFILRFIISGTVSAFRSVFGRH